MAITTEPTVSVVRRSNNPGCLISGLWFIFFGWWIGGLAVLTAWLLGVTIIGLPFSLFILNHVPFLLLLQPPGSEQLVANGPNGTVVKERPVQQIHWFWRTLYFIFVGWWWSLVWTILSYVACLTIIGLPLGLLMFRLAPAMTTLKRY